MNTYQKPAFTNPDEKKWHLQYEYCLNTLDLPKGWPFMNIFCFFPLVSILI